LLRPYSTGVLTGKAGPDNINNMKRKITYLLFLLAFSSVSLAQENPRIEENFLTASQREKLEIMASNPYDDIKDRFEGVEDTIESIRERLYSSKNENKEEKFLLDQVDINRATDQKNDGAALYILENALRYHVKAGFDSLYCFKMLRNIIESNKNDAILMKQYHAASEKWGPYFLMDAKIANSTTPIIAGGKWNRSVSNYFIAGMIGLMIIIIFLLFYTRRFRRREKQLSVTNNQIQVQHKQIEQSLKEKEALIREIHHRVKNNLQIINSMLNLQIGKIDDEKTESIFFEAKQRINAIALTHQMLYQKETLSNINVSEYIGTLVRQIENTMGTPAIELEVKLEDLKSRVTIDGAVPLGLVINELLTNAYKHAFPKGRKGKILVSLIETPTAHIISVKDNGVGLPEGFNYSESTSLGMELVYILVEQLESSLKIENQNGTTFSFEIPKVSRHQ
jgi:two-component sensor histidine kinase